METRRFRFGAVCAALTTPLRSVLDDYTELYRHSVSTIGHRGEIHVQVTPRPRSLRHRRRFDVTVNGRRQFEPGRLDEILPCIEWSIGWEVPRILPHYLQIHASAMEVDGQGVIFPGLSGRGKSTLTVGLLTRGWRYLSDEFALLEADSLQLHAYPRAICIKRPAFPVLEQLRVRLHRDKCYLKGAKGFVGFVRPLDVRPDCLGRACRIQFIVFPQYTPGTATVLVPMHRAEAAFALHETCFNLLNCRRPGLEVMVAMIRDVRCYRLFHSDIQATCDTLQELVIGARQQRQCGA